MGIGSSIGAVSGAAAAGRLPPPATAREPRRSGRSRACAAERLDRARTRGVLHRRSPRPWPQPVSVNRDEEERGNRMSDRTSKGRPQQARGSCSPLLVPRPRCSRRRVRRRRRRRRDDDRRGDDRARRHGRSGRHRRGRRDERGGRASRSRSASSRTARARSPASTRRRSRRARAVHRARGDHGRPGAERRRRVGGRRAPDRDRLRLLRRHAREGARGGQAPRRAGGRPDPHGPLSG